MFSDSLSQGLMLSPLQANHPALGMVVEDLQLNYETIEGRPPLQCNAAITLLRGWLNDPQCHCFIPNQWPHAGYVVLRQDRSNGTDFLEVLRLYVQPGLRRQSYGTQLLRSAMAILWGSLRTPGTTTAMAWLPTAASHLPAWHFFKQFGFEIAHQSIRDGYAHATFQL